VYFVLHCVSYATLIFKTCLNNKYTCVVVHIILNVFGGIQVKWNWNKEHFLTRNFSDLCFLPSIFRIVTFRKLQMDWTYSLEKCTLIIGRGNHIGSRHLEDWNRNGKIIIILLCLNSSVSYSCNFISFRSATRTWPLAYFFLFLSWKLEPCYCCETSFLSMHFITVMPWLCIAVWLPCLVLPLLQL
jgi:hypothetical protein